MVVMACAQTACRATARVARTRTRSRSIPSRVLVRATARVALGARSRDLFSQLNPSSLDAYGMGLASIRFPTTLLPGVLAPWAGWTQGPSLLGMLVSPYKQLNPFFPHSVAISVLADV